MAGTPQILFYPRGDSSGGSLEIKQAAGRSELLSVDWLSGRVRRGAEAPPSRRPKSLDQDDKDRDRDANDEREVGGALNE
jgi:general secretion pathway protein H